VREAIQLPKVIFEIEGFPAGFVAAAAATMCQVRFECVLWCALVCFGGVVWGGGGSLGAPSVVMQSVWFVVQ